MALKNCVVCGAEFEAAHPATKLCSEACRREQVSLYNKKRYYADIEASRKRVREKNKNLRDSDPERFRDYAAQRRILPHVAEENRRRAREWRATRSQEEKESMKEYQRLWARQRYHQNKEIMRQRANAWRQANPDKARKGEHDRIARRKALKRDLLKLELYNELQQQGIIP